MAALSILHAADLHLGGPVAAPEPALEDLAAGARGQALERLVELSRQREAGLVLLAGDVFHSPTPPLAAVLALQKALAAWQDMGARVFIAPGNHDPWLPGGVWESWEETPGLTIFGPQARGVELAERGLWVAGAAHGSPAETRDLAAVLPPPPAGRVGLAVLHANLASAKSDMAHEPYAPASLPALLSGPFALWALGHIHIPQELSQHPRVLYAGSLQGAHLGETGPRGAWLLTVDEAVTQAEFVPLAPLEYYDLALTGLERVETPAALVAQVRPHLQGPSSPWPTTRCLRLGLAGPSPLWPALRREEPGALAAVLKQELGVAGLVLNADGLCPPADPAVLAQRPDVLGRALVLIDQAQDDPEVLAALEKELASSLHPDQRNLPPDQRREWLRGLLDEARWLILGGLHHGGPEHGDAA